MRDDDERVATVLTITSRLSDELSQNVAELVALLTSPIDTEADDDDR